MNSRNLIFATALWLLAFGCKESEILKFDAEQSGIYFQRGGQTRMFINIDSYTDSVAFSFSSVSDKVLDTLMDVRVRTMGNVKDYPRPVKISIDRDRTTATEGLHFVMDPNKAVVPAGMGEFRFPVRFMRTPDMFNREFVLALKLEDNEHFKVYFTKQKNTNVYNSVSSEINADRFKFIVGELYTQPNYWRTVAVSHFGTWTVAKYKFVNQTMNWTAGDWSTAGTAASGVQSGRLPLAATIVRNALQALADKGTPLREANGSFMQLGNSYLVDYSKNI